MSKRGYLEARAVNEEDWVCRIEDSSIGILGAKWSPDSRHIITFSDYQVDPSFKTHKDIKKK